MEVYKGCVVWDEHKQPNIMFGGSAWTGANVILRILNCRGCHGDKIHPSSPTQIKVTGQEIWDPVFRLTGGARELNDVVVESTVDA